MIENNFPMNLFIKNQNSINENVSNDVSHSQNNEENNLLTEEILRQLKDNIGTQKFETYFAQTFSIKEINVENIVCSTTTAFIKKMIESQYLEILQTTVTQALGRNFHIIIEVNSGHSTTLESNNNPNNANSGYTLHPSIQLKSEQNNEQNNRMQNNYNIHRGKTAKDISFSINDLRPTHDDLQSHVTSSIINQTDKNIHSRNLIDPKRNFECFVVGPSNNLAHAAAIAVAKNPGTVYQSLYLYGNSGLGKTHLLHSIANHILETKPQLRIHMTTATEFMSEMITAIQEKSITQFRKKYSEQIDVLMIDDIHELKNREGTQNEFFHIFNDLQRRKKQLIFTSDKDPKEINGIEDRIKTRLSSALVLEIQQPDLETRIAILKKKAIDKDIYLPDDVVNMIASCIKNNIRELEGSLIKLGAYSSIFKVDIDLQTAKEQLKIDDEEQKKTITIETVTGVVAKFYQLTVPDLRSKNRSKEVTIARHISMYLCYYMAKCTLTEIGNYYGKRDHTSVIHAVNKIKGLQKTDPAITQALYEIECHF